MPVLLQLLAPVAPHCHISKFQYPMLFPMIALLCPQLNASTLLHYAYLDARVWPAHLTVGSWEAETRSSNYARPLVPNHVVTGSFALLLHYKQRGRTGSLPGDAVLMERLSLDTGCGDKCCFYPVYLLFAVSQLWHYLCFIFGSRLVRLKSPVELFRRLEALVPSRAASLSWTKQNIVTENMKSFLFFTNALQT